jgi:signal transduction histidine kinase
MKKIFLKFLLTYVGVLALTLFFLSLLLFQFLEAHLFREKQDALLDTARYVGTLLSEYRRGNLPEAELQKAVNMIGETTNSRILILDGIDPAGSGSQAGSLPGFPEEDFSASLARILRGETLTFRRLYYRELDVNVVAVGLPVQDSSQQTRGAVILFSPVNPLERALQRARGIISITALAALLLATSLLYYMAKKISDPIISVSRAAVALAGGDRLPDLPPGPRDEVGQLIQSFNFMKNQLEKLERLRREFLTGISHELRTPLTAIRGFVQAIVDGVIPPREEEKYLRLTLAETGRLAGLVDDLLDLGRLEAGSVALNYSYVNLSDLLREVVDFMAAQAAEKEVALQLETAKVSLTADGDRLKQVAWNLLANALAYTPPSGRVRVALEEAQDEVLLTVEDTGVGIPAEDLPHIFTVFYRVDRSRDPATGGTGLGLAIVKNIVDLHRGRIEVESRPGRGTWIRIRLPKEPPRTGQ